MLEEILLVVRRIEACPKGAKRKLQAGSDRLAKAIKDSGPEFHS